MVRTGGGIIIERTMVRGIVAGGLANLLDQAVRMIHATNHSRGLYPGQWMALRYCRDALPRSRTIADIARFQGINLNVASRTVRTLIDRGFLDRLPNPRSKKSDLLALTAAGRDILNDDPQAVLTRLLNKLSPDDQAAFASILRTLVESLMLEAEGEFDYESPHDGPTGQL